MRIKQFLIAVCVGTMLAACSSKDDFSITDDNTIRLVPKIYELKTRVNANDPDLQNSDVFVDNEKVNVYIKKTGTDENVEGISGDKLVYTSLGAQFTTPAEQPQFPESGGVDVYAIYPATIDKTKSTFKVKTSQTTAADYRASDLMYAVATNKQKEDGSIYLNFFHCLSKVIVKFDNSEYNFGITDIMHMQLRKAYTSIGISHSQTTGITLNTSELGDMSSIEFGGDYTTNSWTAVVIPQTIPQGETLFLIQFELGYNNFMDFECKASEDITFLPGHVHTITIKPNMDGVSLKYDIIEAWNSGTNYPNETIIPN